CFHLRRRSSLRYFSGVANFRAHGVMCRALQHSLGTAYRRCFPPVNLHSARVHRNRARPRPNGFNGRAQSSPPSFTPYRECASVSAFTRSLARFWSLFLFDSRESRLSLPGTSVPLCLELPPMLNADTPVRIRVNSVGTPP